MTLSEFKTITHGKWILAGEHAVLRESPAIVFPLLEKELRLTYTPTSEPLSVSFSGLFAAEVECLFRGVLENGLTAIDQRLSDVRGHFKIDNTIPVGMGLGVSAAMSAALAQWFMAQNFPLHDDENLLTLARRLENIFHGESSGVDIAGAVAESGIYFKRPDTMQAIECAWQPNLYLTYSAKKGITSACVRQVQELWQTDKNLAAQLDADMQEAVAMAQQALAVAAPDSEAKLLAALDLANQCFIRWGLVEQYLSDHMAILREHGALALKPTGSGGGGYVLSIWPAGKQPPAELDPLALRVPVRLLG